MIALAQRDNFKIDSSKLIILIIIGCLLHTYFFTVYSPSIDSEYAFFRKTPSAWVSQSRWFTALLEAYVLRNPSSPFIAYLVYSITMALSYLIILNLYKVKWHFSLYCIYPIFCAHPIWWAILEFNANTLGIGVAFLLTTISVCLTTENLINKISVKQLPSFILSAILLACAIATYQTYVLLYVSMVIGLGILLRKGEGCFNLFCIHFITLLIGFAVYLFINMLLHRMLIPSSNYIEGMISITSMTDDIRGFIRRNIFLLRDVYRGGEYYYGAKLGVIKYVVVLGFISYIIFYPHRFRNFVLLSTLIVIPFGVLFFSSGGYFGPRLLIPTLPFVIWFFAYLMLRVQNKKIFPLFFLLIILAVIQMLSVNSRYSVTATLRVQNDILLANDVYQRALIANNFEPKIKLLTYGAKRFSTPYPSLRNSITNSSFFSHDNGNIGRIVTFMNLLGFPVEFPTSNEISNVENYFGEMPIWPEKGSVKNINGIILIKFSEKDS